jgi:hypothetical protein
MKIIITSVLSATTLLMAGCASTLQVDRGTVQAVANLDRDQYEIVGNVEGQASVSYVFFFFPTGAKPQSGVLFNPYFVCPFGPPPGPVMGMAIYNAIESQPGVDMIIAPRFESEVKGFPPFYWTTTVKVKGKGIKIK